MCGHGLIGLVALSRLHEIKVTAEVEDLTSQPIRATPIAPPVTGEHRLPRLATADAA